MSSTLGGVGGVGSSGTNLGGCGDGTGAAVSITIAPKGLLLACETVGVVCKL